MHALGKISFQNRSAAVLNGDERHNGDKVRFRGQQKHFQKLVSEVLASTHSVTEHNLISLVY